MTFTKEAVFILGLSPSHRLLDGRKPELRNVKDGFAEEAVAAALGNPVQRQNVGYSLSKTCAFRFSDIASRFSDIVLRFSDIALRFSDIAES